MKKKKNEDERRDPCDNNRGREFVRGDREREKECESGRERERESKRAKEIKKEENQPGMKDGSIHFYLFLIFASAVMSQINKMKT